MTQNPDPEPPERNPQLPSDPVGGPTPSRSIEEDEDLPALGPALVPREDLRPVERTAEENRMEGVDEGKAGGAGDGDARAERPKTPERRDYNPIAKRTLPVPPPADEPKDEPAEENLPELSAEAPAPAPAPPVSPVPEAAATVPPIVPTTAPSAISVDDGQGAAAGPDPGDSTAAPDEADGEAAPASDPGTGDGWAKGEVVAAPAAGPLLKPLHRHEKLSLLLLAAGVVIAALLTYAFIRGALPGAGAGAVATGFPVSGDQFVLKEGSVGWRQVESGQARVRLGVGFVPQIQFRVEGSGSGALRVVFFNERGQQRGDTENITITNGIVAGVENNLVTLHCTDGLGDLLEYNDLRARQTLFWTVEVREGSDPQGRGDTFRPILRLSVPWTLVNP